MIPGLPQLFKATVINRPSKTIKSPSVADIRLEDGSVALCHTPGLGCCGLVSTDRVIYVSKAANPDSKTGYTAQISESHDDEGTFYVGIHPMQSQKAAGSLLEKLTVEPLVWKSEVAVNSHTRLDFVGTNTDGRKTYVEVKNAMISVLAGPRAKRRAVFPEGYRKTLADTVSPRAVKHAETLAELVKLPDTEAAYLMFIVPRTDCLDGLVLNRLDPIYCKAVTAAMVAGVKVRAFSVEFNIDGSVKFHKKLNFFVP